METTLAKNRSGFWEVRWSEEDPGTKIWRSKSVSTRTKNRKDAVAFRDAWIAGLKQDMTAAVAAAAALKVPTLAELIEDYIEHHVEANRKAKSQSQSLVFPKRMLGHMKADELDVKVITDYRLSR